MKIYTRAGDDGLTALIGGQRVPKDAPRIAAYGEVDQLNAWIGVCRAQNLPSAVDESLERLQHELFSVGAELAAPDADERQLAVIDAAHVRRLEAEIDQFDGGLTPLKNFILPAGTSVSASLHAARCTCRAAERSVVTLSHDEPVRPVLLRYLNRVSDLLFVLARTVNASAGVQDVLWKKPE